MTLEELQKMSDEELSVLAGMKVMGWSREDIYNANGHGPFRGGGGAGPWDPAEDMKDAMELADKIAEEGWNMALLQKNGEYGCGFSRGEIKHGAYKETAARCITIASILAKE